MLRVKACGLSDVGLARVHNEDYFEIDPRHCLYVVADGMGGHSYGEVAAQIAVKAIHDFVERSVDRDSTWSFKLPRVLAAPPDPERSPWTPNGPAAPGGGSHAPATSGVALVAGGSVAAGASAALGNSAALGSSGAAGASAPSRPAAEGPAGGSGALAGLGEAAGPGASGAPTPPTPQALQLAAEAPQVKQAPPAPNDDERLARHSRLLKMAVRRAHDNVLTAISKDGSLHGMGTTVVGLLLVGPTAAVAHVGDSRAYRLRSGRLDQLTQDHTWVHEQVVAGLLSQEQARSHPLKNVVTRALGGESEVVVDVREVQVQPGDLYLLCSDGLTGMLSDSDIRERLGSGRTLHEICRSLVNEANARGGLDNVTVVLLSVEDADDGEGTDWAPPT
jgi:serine/threonine protein phosphatase PrpC